MRALYFALAVIFFSVGFVGIFLPLLPTTPFILLSCFFFSKSSPRFHQMILNSKWFGPSVRDWEESGVIRLKPKILATILILLSGGYVILFRLEHLGLKVGLGVFFVVILALIWSRPSEKKKRA